MHGSWTGVKTPLLSRIFVYFDLLPVDDFSIRRLVWVVKTIFKKDIFVVNTMLKFSPCKKRHETNCSYWKTKVFYHYIDFTIQFFYYTIFYIFLRVHFKMKRKRLEQLIHVFLEV